MADPGRTGGDLSDAPDRSFWKGRGVFLTGHTGFKGSWLSLWLRALGAQVTGYALAPPTHPSLFESAGVESAVRSIRADIRDLPRLSAVVAESRPSVVIHMAAQSVVRRSYEDPIETYSSNVMGTVHVLEAVRRCGRPCVVVNITSDKCYENTDKPRGYREADPLGGRDPYSNSKACGELVTRAYRDSFFQTGPSGHPDIAVATARAGNVIGGGDWTENQLVPDLIRAFLADEPCLIRNPSAIRPWQFVLEPLWGYLKLAERLAADGGQYASAWNFGPDGSDAKPVSWIATELANAWGGRAAWRQDEGRHPHETGVLKLDSSKARTYLRWHPVLNLSQALDWVLEWYRAFAAKDDLGRLTLAQIKKYEALLGS
jgi:CDP-glucose 4,6-dehydratase